MEPTPLYDKLKDEFATIIIGVLVAIPAIGIVIPKAFSILADQQGVELPGLFKIFSLLYFSMPLILLFVLSFLQFNNDVLIRLRKMVYGIILLLVVFFILLLFPIWGNKSFKINPFVLFAVIIVILWGFYWFFFHATIKQIISAIKELKESKATDESKLKELEAPIKYPKKDIEKFDNENINLRKRYYNKISLRRKKRSEVTDDIGKIDEKIAENIASIKLGIFYLFIASQLVIVISLTLFNKLNNDGLWITIMLISYVAVLVYYRFQPGLRALQKEERISKSFVPGILAIATIGIIITFYVSKSKTTSFDFSANRTEYIRNFDGITKAIASVAEIKKLDSRFKKIDSLKADAKTKNLPVSFLKLLLDGDRTNSDSVALFNARAANYYSALYSDEKVDMDSLLIEIFSTNPAQADSAKTLSGKILQLEKLIKPQSILKSYSKGATSGYTNSIAKQKKEIAEDPFYDSLQTRSAKRAMTWQIQQNVNILKRNEKVIEAEVRTSEAKRQQVNIIKDTQHAGIIIFITTLIVLASFLLILTYRDDKYHEDTLPEIDIIKKNLQIVCLIVAILLIPLIKIVPEDQVNPEKPSSLFLVGNWNLLKPMPEEGATDQKNTISWRTRVDYSQITDSLNLKRCCNRLNGKDTLVIKLPYNSVETINGVLGELTQAINNNTAHVNDYTSALNDIIVKMSQNSITSNNPGVNYTRILNNMNSLLDSIKEGQKTGNGHLFNIDTAAKQLQRIRTVIENSQRKSPPKSQK